MAEFSTNEDYAKVRQTDHDQLGSFGLILTDGHKENALMATDTLRTLVNECGGKV
jgi:hypothetical protein